MPTRKRRTKLNLVEAVTKHRELINARQEMREGKLPDFGIDSGIPDRVASGIQTGYRGRDLCSGLPQMGYKRERLKRTLLTVLPVGGQRGDLWEIPERIDMFVQDTTGNTPDVIDLTPI